MRNLICDWNGIWQISENINRELIVSTPGKDERVLKISRQTGNHECLWYEELRKCEIGQQPQKRTETCSRTKLWAFYNIRWQPCWNPDEDDTTCIR